MTAGFITLSYQSTKVGYIRSAFESDATWYGVFESTLAPDDGPLERRLLEFIKFCIDWNERTLDNPDAPAASEFDAYSDVTSGLWKISSPGGEVRKIREAPVFFEANEVSWKVE